MRVFSVDSCSFWELFGCAHRSIYHDEKFTYIKTNAPEKFSVYKMKDGKPNLVNYDLREGTYIIPKVMDSGYVELSDNRTEFMREGVERDGGADDDSEYAVPPEPELRRREHQPRGVLRRNLKPLTYLGATALVVIAAIFSGSF